MSEETTTEKQPTPLHERLNNAFIANGYTLLNGGDDNIVMVTGEKNGNEIELLFTYDGLVEAVESLKPDTIKKIITP